jgi:hypothetical protein
VVEGWKGWAWAIRSDVSLIIDVLESIRPAWREEF